MASFPPRAPVGDHLLTPQNAALLIIDYQLSWVQVLCELQRDWNRTATAQSFGELLFAVEGR